MRLDAACLIANTFEFLCYSGPWGQIDTVNHQPFPIVGLGASAGGLAAFKEFFDGAALVEHPEAAFVLIQHLDPSHPSHLVELVQRLTTLRVYEAKEAMPVRKHSVYVIPEGCQATIRSGSLHLTGRMASIRVPLPIDVFFRSLAEDQRDFAVAVVLSGTGTDGTQGVREVRNRGGFVLAQSRESCQFYGMPESAVASGQVDLVLPANQMVVEIQNRFQAHPGSELLPLAATPEWTTAAGERVFALLRARTNHDFSNYKPSTVQRRIARRMALHRCPDLDAYLHLLTGSPDEVDCLFDDLLIGVTSFFRDPAVFQVLADNVVTKILLSPPEKTTLRVWSAGCSTGEEAFSLAMVLNEKITAIDKKHKVQVFATDIDKKAITTARAARYPASITDDVSAERLERFFTAEASGKAYRIQKHLRDQLIFSVHDLIKDPPFFKLDLLVCRNLLIYLSLDLQRTIIPMFHYALNPGGILVLGTSETIGEYGHLFEPLDRASKLYIRRESRSDYPQRQYRYQALPKTEWVQKAPTRSPISPQSSLKELAENMILQVQDMAAAVVTAQGEVLHLHGRTGYFLEPPPGAAGVTNILKMAKESLKYAMATALHQASQSGVPVHARDLTLTWKNQTTVVHLSVHPMTQSIDPLNPLFLILLEESQNPSELAVLGTDSVGNQHLELIRREFATKEKFLETASEEMEASNEELRLTNEELQSVNEELQSSNEELETQREELQSVNEELSSVNTELFSKMAELSTTNNDMNNLLAATGVATVFVDLRLNILRFTPEANRVLNLIPSDVGRSVGDLSSNLVDYQHLEPDAQEVIQTLVPKVLEVCSRWGIWYRLRIQPYRTLDNSIEGAVITFIDISELVRQRALLQLNNDQLRLLAIPRDSRDAIVVHGLDGRLLAWSPGAVAQYGWSEQDALAMHLRDLVPLEARDSALEKLRAIGLSDVLETYRTQRLKRDGQVFEVSATSSALVGPDQLVYGIFTIERPIGSRVEGDLPEFR